MPVRSCGREEGGHRQGPQLGAGHWPPWPGPASAPAGSGGLVLCLDRKINEFHYGIAILFHVSGSLRLTCSPGCDKPRHPRARARARGLRTRSCETLPCPPRASRAVLSHTDCSWEPCSTWGGGKDQGQGSGTATVLSHVLKALQPPKDLRLADRRGANHDPSTALGGRVLPNNRLGGRKEVGHGGLGAFTIADDTGNLTRPVGCSYLTSARWLPALGGHEGRAVVSGPCCAEARGRLLSPHRPPCAGAGSWLCLLEALRIPVRGSLAFETSPGTEAVGSRNKQPKGSSDARARRCLPALGWGARDRAPAPLGAGGELWVLMGGPVQVTGEKGRAEQVSVREVGVIAFWEAVTSAGGALWSLLHWGRGTERGTPGGRHPCSIWMGGGGGAGQARSGQEDKVGSKSEVAQGWLWCPGMRVGAIPRSSWVRWGGGRVVGARLGRLGGAGKVSLGQMQPLHPPPVLCTLMQMHWPEWFISSMWNGIMHPHPISLMKKREPAPGTKLPTLG